MPITQNRMLRLIQAAENIQSMNQGLITSILAKADQIRSGHLTHEQAFNDLTIEYKAYEAGNNSVGVILEERWRFNLTYSRNVYEKKRQEQKRRSEGMAIQQNRRPEPNLTATTPNPILSTAAHMARVAAEIEESDNIPDEYEFVDVSKPSENPDDVAALERYKFELEERERLKQQAAEIDARINLTKITKI